MRNDAADDECITEEKAGGGFEDAGELTKKVEAGANVAEDIVGEGGVERGIDEG